MMMAGKGDLQTSEGTILVNKNTTKMIQHKIQSDIIYLFNW